MAELWPIDDNESELILDVLMESRGGPQLHPTKTVWEEYFGIDFDSETNRTTSSQSITVINAESDEEHTYNIPPHDHQLTIEIPELDERDDRGDSNDFIIFVEQGNLRYEYEVFIEGEDDEVNEIEEFMSHNGEIVGNIRRAYAGGSTTLS